MKKGNTMKKEAYEAGVEQALIDAGLLGVTKQAGVADSASPLLLKLKALLGSGKEFGAQGLESLSGLGARGLESLSGLGTRGLESFGALGPAAQGGIVGGAAGAGGTALGGGDIGDILLGTGLGAGAGAGASVLGRHAQKRIADLLTKRRLGLRDLEQQQLRQARLETDLI